MVSRKANCLNSSCESRTIISDALDCVREMTHFGTFYEIITIER